MNKISRITVFLLLVFSCSLLAESVHGPSHGHGHSHDPITTEEAITKALGKVTQLVQKGTIDQSWSSIREASAEKKTFSKGPEWVITLKNESVTDTSKQTLYIFFSLDGHYIATNYTGE